MTSDFDYKKYSLEKLQEWVHDSLSTGEASPHEIYSAIREAVNEDHQYYKDHAARAYGLLELLSGHRPVAEYTGSTVSSVKETKDLKEVDPQEYFNEQAYNEVNNSQNEENTSQWTYKGKPATYDEIVADGWEMTADGFWWRETKEEDKPKKWRWVLPVEETTDAETGLEEYFVTFPNDLLYKTNLKEGDKIEWVDQGDGSYLLRKVKND